MLYQEWTKAQYGVQSVMKLRLTLDPLALDPPFFVLMCSKTILGHSAVVYTKLRLLCLLLLGTYRPLVKAMGKWQKIPTWLKGNKYLY